MSADFDPYYVWLGIPAEDQPADFYRLLGLQTFEDNPDVIANAMEQRLQFLRSRQAGKHQALSQRLANEISTAAGCLLDAERKAAYDLELRARVAPAAWTQPPALLAPPLPVAASPVVVTPKKSLPASRAPDGVTLAGALFAVLAFAMAAIGFGMWATGRFDREEPVAAQVQSATRTLPIKTTPEPKTVPVVAPLAPTPMPDAAAAVGTAGSGRVPQPPNAATTPPPSVQIAITVEESGKVDLLERGASSMVVKRGAVTWRQGALCLEGEASALAIPVKFPAQYALEADVVRDKGTNSLCFGIPVHGRPLTAIVDGFYSKRSGLACINGQELYSKTNPFVREGPALVNGKSARIRIEVTREHVELEVNSRSLVRWPYDARARIQSAQGMAAPELDQLHIFAWEASYGFTRLELVPLH